MLVLRTDKAKTVVSPFPPRALWPWPAPRPSPCPLLPGQTPAKLQLQVSRGRPGRWAATAGHSAQANRVGFQKEGHEGRRECRALGTESENLRLIPTRHLPVALSKSLLPPLDLIPSPQWGGPNPQGSESSCEMGRVGKGLAPGLKGSKAHVLCTARNPENTEMGDFIPCERLGKHSLRIWGEAGRIPSAWGTRQLCGPYAERLHCSAQPRLCPLGDIIILPPAGGEPLPLLSEKALPLPFQQVARMGGGHAGGRRPRGRRQRAAST